MFSEGVEMEHGIFLNLKLNLYFEEITQLAFICSNAQTEAPEQSMKSV